MPQPSNRPLNLPGFTDDTEGWDFGGRCVAAAGGGCGACAPGPDASDEEGTGTHLAALAVGEANALTRTAGVAPGARAMALRISDCHSGQMWASHAVEALGYALRQGASVVLAPWAGAAVADPTGSSNGSAGGAAAVQLQRRQLFLDALAPLQRAGVLVVAADVAGGDGLPCALSGQLDNVLCIGAADGSSRGHNTSTTTSSNSTGNTKAAADLFAPGASLPAAFAGAAHANASGASAAAAVGAGAAALVWSSLGKRLGGDHSALAPMVKRLMVRSAAAADEAGGVVGSPAGFNVTIAAAPGALRPRLRLTEGVKMAASPNLPGDISVFPEGAEGYAGGAPLTAASSSSSSSSSVQVTVSRPGATLSWYVNSYGATNAAVLQSVLHRVVPAMSIAEWEFASKGETVLSVGLSAQLPVKRAGGGYVIRAESGDAFALWLGGRRLMLVDDPAVGAAGTVAEGGQSYWTAGVAFTEPGESITQFAMHASACVLSSLQLSKRHNPNPSHQPPDRPRQLHADRPRLPQGRRRPHQPLCRRLAAARRRGL